MQEHLYYMGVINRSTLTGAIASAGSVGATFPTPACAGHGGQRQRGAGDAALAIDHRDLLLMRIGAAEVGMRIEGVDPGCTSSQVRWRAGRASPSTTSGSIACVAPSITRGVQC